MAEANAQYALGGDTGEHFAVVFYSRKSGATPADLRDAVASLIQFAQPASTAFRLLIGVSPSAMEGHKAYQDAGLKTDPEAILTGTSGQADLIIQVGAETNHDRLFALRALEDALSSVAERQLELLGDRILNGQEPFGFADNNPSRELARQRMLGLVPEVLFNAGNGTATWLVSKIFETNLTAFANKSDLEQASIVGKPMAQRPHLALSAGDTANSHKQRMSDVKPTAPMVRRSTRFRSGGAEGLAFVALASDPSVFTQYLERFASDPLRGYVTDRAPTGIYFVPPTGGWLGSVRDLSSSLPTAKLVGQHGNLRSYDLAPSLRQYMLDTKPLALVGTPGRMTLHPDVNTMLALVHEWLGQRKASSPPYDAGGYSQDDTPVLTPESPGALLTALGQLLGELSTTRQRELARLLTLTHQVFERAKNTDQNRSVIEFPSDSAGAFKELFQGGIDEANAINGDFDDYITYGG